MVYCTTSTLPSGAVEILGLAGLMGAGRTELGRALFGADAIDAGTLTLNGTPTRIKDVADAIEKGISYLTEDRKKEGLALGLSVEMNIMLSNYPDYAGVAGNVDEKRCRESSQKLVDALRIKTPHLEQAALNLSGGNQQKIIIARWVCKDTDILIFDEPTRGIDVGAKLEIYELMNRLVAKGKSIIMISSELPEVLGMCDRILVMRSGHIAGEIEAEHATQKNHAIRHAGGLIMSVTVPSPQSGSHTMKINKALLMRLAPLFSLVLLVLFFSFSSPFFFNTENIMTIALQTAVIGIMAIGVTFVIITAGIEPVARIGGGVFRGCGGHRRRVWYAAAGLYSGRRARRRALRLCERVSGHQNDHTTVYCHPRPDDVGTRHQYGDDRWPRNLFF